MPANNGGVTYRAARAAFAAAHAAGTARESFEAYWARVRAGAPPAPDGPGDVPASAPATSPGLDWDEHEERTTPDAAPAATPASRVVCVINDVHIPNQHPVAWAVFRAWHRDVRPAETIVLGDGIDLAAASRFALDDKDTPFLVDEFKAFGREMNALAAECGALTIALGNHEARLAKALAGQSATALRGLRGVSFREIAEANGLTAPVQWFAESLARPGLVRGQFLLQHGDRQAGRFGGGMHLAAQAIAKSNGQSICRGHHHRGQLFARSAYGKTTVGVASPCLTRDHDYAGGQSADWQRGWTVLELAAPDYATATPQVLLVIDGAVSWGGRTWRST